MEDNQEYKEKQESMSIKSTLILIGSIIFISIVGAIILTNYVPLEEQLITSISTDSYGIIGWNFGVAVGITNGSIIDNLELNIKELGFSKSIDINYTKSTYYLSFVIMNARPNNYTLTTIAKSSSGSDIMETEIIIYNKSYLK